MKPTWEEEQRKTQKHLQKEKKSRKSWSRDKTRVEMIHQCPMFQKEYKGQINY